MRLSERDLRTLLACAGQVAAVADPERFQTAVLAALFTIAQAEQELFDLQTDRLLTKRERELLARAMHGETNQEIAEALVISPRTVAKHLEHAYAKLGVHSRREAARLAAKGVGYASLALSTVA
jgi:DNA-binding CsgD family transcriptional regulator